MRAAPIGSAPAVLPCRRRRAASCRAARVPARAAAFSRSRSQPTLTVEVALRFGHAIFYRPAALPCRLFCRPLISGPWASEGPSACRPARAGRREVRTQSPQTKQKSR
eukprot:1324371-Prymnesium_polylepis.1